MTFTIGGVEIGTLKFIIGSILMIISGFVIIGGIQRIGVWAGKMVPLMIIIYFFSVLAILIIHIDKVPHYFLLIITDAFSAENYHGDPALGGLLGGLNRCRVRRASFSNEAGIGTAPMALGASQSSEPIREGLVSMISPVDRYLTCLYTHRIGHFSYRCLANFRSQWGFINWVAAFQSSMPGIGKYLLLLCAFFLRHYFTILLQLLRK